MEKTKKSSHAVSSSALSSLPKGASNRECPTKSEMEKVNRAFSENSLRMMKKRYLAIDESGRQETPAEMFHRAAHTLAEIERNYGHNDKFIEKTERDFFGILSKKEYTPAGRTLTNVGGPTALIANCIVLPVLDSMEEIFQTLREAALLQQAGSGLGFDFSHLRPAMWPTKKSRGTSSGPVSFLKIYDASFGIIKQQGRHGANMAMMEVTHPDVLDFISSKKVEGEIRNFNISIKVTDEFMKKLVESPNEQWLCEWKGEKMKPHRVLRAPNGAVVGTEEIDITVKELFDILIEHAWLNGEPGIVFIDEVNRTNPLPGLGAIDCSNPCVTGDTLVATEKGFLKIEELVKQYAEGGLKILTDNRVPVPAYLHIAKRSLVAANTHSQSAYEFLPEINYLPPQEGISLNTISQAFKTGVKQVVKLITKQGYELTLTPDHKVLTTEGWAEAKDCFEKDILIQSGEGQFNTDSRIPFEVVNEVKGKNGHMYRYNFPTHWSKELGQILGWLIGDGWLRDTPKQYTVGFTFSEQDKEVMDVMKKNLNIFYRNSNRREIKRKNGVYHLLYGSKDFVAYFKNLGVKPLRADKKELPRLLWQAPQETVIGFLQGLFTADGTVRDNPKSNSSWIALTAKSRKLLQEVQLLLLNLGIKSTIFDRSRPMRENMFPYTNKAGKKVTYTTDGTLYELGIFGESRERFKGLVNFLNRTKREKLEKIRFKKFYIQHFTARVTEIIPLGEQAVYDLTEPTTHSMICNGLVVHQCGEQFLHHYDNCNLGSINLALFVKDPSTSSGRAGSRQVDWNHLRRTTKIATRLMDNVIDLFDFPVEKVTALAKKNRRIGLGIMGFADMIYQLGVAYNSEEGRRIAEKAMKMITDAAHEMSQELAEEKGAFPNIGLSIFAKKKIKMRNAALTTVAPTGSISMMFDCSSGIEPNFALSYVKQDKDGQQYHYFNSYFEQALKDYKFSAAKLKEIKDEIIKTGSIQGLIDLPEELRRTFVVAMDISAEDHITMQAAFQRHVDNSISKTINFPNSATREDVLNGFIMAWKAKCKACTVYRDGSREVQILNLGTGENIKSPTELGAKRISETPLELPVDKGRLEARKRPEVLTGKTYRVKTGYGNLYVTINNDEHGAPFEIFAIIGKSGGFFQEQSEGICRLISLALRAGLKIEEIIDNLKGIRGPMPMMTDKGTILSLPDAIGQVLEEHVRTNGHHNPNPLLEKHEVGDPMMIQEKEPAAVATVAPALDAEQHKKSLADYGLMPGCPDCGAALIMSEGCLSCHSCGFTRCF